MAVKCTECGASIQDDSKFCKYCGAKVVAEDLKCVEVKIDNTAEIKRAEYEERESRLRQIKMERELRKEKRKPYIVIAKILSIILPIALGMIIAELGGNGYIALLLGIFGIIMFFYYFIKLLTK